MSITSCRKILIGYSNKEGKKNEENPGKLNLIDIYIYFSSNGFNLVVKKVLLTLCSGQCQ